MEYVYYSHADEVEQCTGDGDIMDGNILYILPEVFPIII